MLDHVSLAGTVGLDSSQRFAYDSKLMVARKNLREPLLTGSLVFDFNDLGIILEDIGQSGRSQNLFPKVVGFEAVRIGWVTCAVIITFIEWQKPRGLASEFSAHTHFSVVHREMHDATAKLK